MQPSETEKCFALCNSDIERMKRNRGKVFQFSAGEKMIPR